MGIVLSQVIVYRLQPKLSYFVPWLLFGSIFRGNREQAVLLARRQRVFCGALRQLSVWSI